MQSVKVVVIVLFVFELGNYVTSILEAVRFPAEHNPRCRPRLQRFLSRLPKINCLLQENAVHVRPGTDRPPRREDTGYDGHAAVWS